MGWACASLTIIVVVANNDLLHQSVLAQLAPDVLVEGVKVELHLLRIHLVLGVVGGVLVEVRQQYRLRVGWLDMFARAAVAVAARSDLVVETTVDLVLLRAEDGREVVGHRGWVYATVRGVARSMLRTSVQCSSMWRGGVARVRPRWNSQDTMRESWW